MRAVGALTRGPTSTAPRGAPVPSRSILAGSARRDRWGRDAQQPWIAVVIANPREGVSTLARSLPYAAPASSGNRLAAPAPATRHTPRPAPRAELAAALETAATLGGSAAVVLAALLSWADANGTAWPCVASIARRSGKSERTVYDALDRLEEAGVIVRHRPSLGARRRSRESNTYRLAIPPHALPPSSSSRAESPCPPRRVAPARPRRARPAPLSSCSTVAPVVVAPSPSASTSPVVVVAPSASSSRQPPMRSTAASPAVEPVALPVTPSPSTSPVVVVAPVPAETGPSSALVQLKILQTKGPGEPDRQNARTGAQARAATAPPGDRLGSPAVAPSSPEVTPTKKLTRAERAAANRAAWSKRTRPASTAARVPAPRRAMPYRAPVERVPDTGPALAALREWRSTLPALGRETDRESATPAPVPGVRRPDLAQRAPVALQGLLEAFARGHGQPHAGDHEQHRSGTGGDPARSRGTASDALGDAPRVEAKPPSLWCPHSRR